MSAKGQRIPRWITPAAPATRPRCSEERDVETLIPTREHPNRSLLWAVGLPFRPWRRQPAQRWDYQNVVFVERGHYRRLGPRGRLPRLRKRDKNSSGRKVDDFRVRGGTGLAVRAHRGRGLSEQSQGSKLDDVRGQHPWLARWGVPELPPFMPSDRPREENPGAPFARRTYSLGAGRCPGALGGFPDARLC